MPLYDHISAKRQTLTRSLADRLSREKRREQSLQHPAVDGEPPLPRGVSKRNEKARRHFLAGDRSGARAAPADEAGEIEQIVKVFSGCVAAVVG